jgi:hypothetical protein
MLHSFFDRTLYIHHVERFGLCKKRRKNINVCAPKSMRRKKRRKKNERQLISQQKIKGRVLQKGDASSSHKNSTHMHILI